MAIDVNFKGGKIVYDSFDIDFTIPVEEQIYELQEDLLQVQYNNSFILDLGWYPELNPDGYFKISVIKDSDWLVPLYQKETDLKKLKQELQEAILFITSYLKKEIA